MSAQPTFSEATLEERIRASAAPPFTDEQAQLIRTHIAPRLTKSRPGTRARSTRAFDPRDDAHGEASGWWS